MFIPNYILVLRRRVARIHSRKPVKKVKQFFGSSQRISFGDGLAGMNSKITDFLNGLNLEKEVVRQVVSEARLVNQSAEVLVVRPLEFGIMVVQPVNRELKSSSGVETTTPRIRLS